MTTSAHPLDSSVLIWESLREVDNNRIQCSFYPSTGEMFEWYVSKEENFELAIPILKTEKIIMRKRLKHFQQLLDDEEPYPILERQTWKW